MLNMVCMKNHFKTVYSPFIGLLSVRSSGSTTCHHRQLPGLHMRRVQNEDHRSQVQVRVKVHHATVHKQHLKCFQALITIRNRVLA